VNLSSTKKKTKRRQERSTALTHVPVGHARPEPSARASGPKAAVSDGVAGKIGERLDRLRIDARYVAQRNPVRTYDLPLATYPAALTTAARLVEEGKTDEATKVLTTALNALVIVDGPTSIPLLEVQAALKLADETAQKADENERPKRPRRWRPPRWRYGVGKRSATSTTSPQRTSRSRSTT